MGREPEKHIGRVARVTLFRDFRCPDDPKCDMDLTLNGDPILRVDFLRLQPETICPKCRAAHMLDLPIRCPDCGPIEFKAGDVIVSGKIQDPMKLALEGLVRRALSKYHGGAGDLYVDCGGPSSDAFGDCKSCEWTRDALKLLGKPCPAEDHDFCGCLGYLWVLK